MTKFPEDNSQFWEGIYLEDDAGWDLGEATPIFDSMADSISPGKVCIIGCGRGYDAIMFAQKGFEVTAIDFAPSAINAVKDLARKAKLAVNTIENDIFTLAPVYANTYDFIIEQTCFCAINPARRSEYETVVNQLLKPGGKLIGLWFPLDKLIEDGGPPWGTTVEEVKSIFKDGWKIEKEEFPDLSIGPRKGREKLIVFSKT
jgi:SAM-dependent methyltransferase